MKVVVVVGHSVDNQGAYNRHTGMTEYMFNSSLAEQLKDTSLVDMVIVNRNTYKSLPADINVLKPDLVVSLHSNAFNHKASGSETLYYHSSKVGMECAKIMQKNIVEALHLQDRGIKAVYKSGRGGWLLRMTNAPCIIVEPFFIDNDSDLAVAEKNKVLLVSNINKAIKEIQNVLV